MHNIPEQLRPIFKRLLPDIEEPEPIPRYCITCGKKFDTYLELIPAPAHFLQNFTGKYSDFAWEHQEYPVCPEHTVVWETLAKWNGHRIFDDLKKEVVKYNYYSGEPLTGDKSG